MSLNNKTVYNSQKGRQELYSLTNKSILSLRQIQKLIDSLDIIYGFDLAQVILLISASKASGYLNIISEQNELYGVSFSNGCIVQIDNRDETTYIGELLISEQLLTKEELDLILKTKHAPLGKELLRLNKLNKYQLIDILLKQTNLRLTQLINSKSIQLSFSHADVETSEISISYEQLVHLSSDWVFTCVTDQWLKMHYFEFRGSSLKIDTEKLKNQFPYVFEQIKIILEKDFIPIFEIKKSIQLLEFEFKSAVLLRAIHQLVLIDSIQITKFNKSSGLENTPEEIKKSVVENSQSESEITSIKNEAKDLIHNKKYFEAFSLLKKLNQNQIKSSKIELYSLWCLIGYAIDSKTKIDTQILRSRLNNIRPEDRNEAEYFYVMSLYLKFIHKDNEAQKYYLKSCTMNPKFKDFPISSENPLIKLKNIFKLSMLFIIGF